MKRFFFSPLSFLILTLLVLPACSGPDYHPRTRTFSHPGGLVLSLPTGWEPQVGQNREKGAEFQAISGPAGPFNAVMTLRSEKGVPSLDELLSLESEQSDLTKIGAPPGTFSNLILLRSRRTNWGGKVASQITWLADHNGARVVLERISVVVGFTVFYFRFEFPIPALEVLDPLVQSVSDHTRWNPRTPPRSEQISTYRALVETYVTQKRYPDAIRAAKEALGLFPKDPEFHLLLADAAVQGGDSQTAEQAYREAIPLAPDDPRTYQGLAKVLLDQKRPEEAIRLLKKAIALNPEGADSYDALGRAYLAVGKPKEATTSFQRALHRDKKLAEAHLGLARAYHASGRDPDIAVNEFTEALRLKPSLKEVHCEIRDLYISQGYTDEAAAEEKLCPTTTTEIKNPNSGEPAAAGGVKAPAETPAP